MGKSRTRQRGQQTRTTTNNEGKACDAVIRSLERRTGHGRADLWCPEKEGADPPVELRFRLGNTHYAMEHTRIEAFEKQIQSGVQFEQMIGSVTEELCGTLPGEAIYTVHFPLRTSLKVKSRKLTEMQKKLTEWVRENATRLDEKSRADEAEQQGGPGQDSIVGTPPGFDYEIALHRYPRRGLGRQERGWIGAVRIAPEDGEPLRTSRVRKALDDKREKLQKCKREGAQTILVLESDDIALSNHVVIGEAVLNALEGHSDTADEIYLVETEMDPWIVRTMKREADCWPNIDEGFQQFNQEELSDLTGGKQ